MWFLSRRKRFNGEVAALLPTFGIDMEEAGVMKLLNVLDIAWSHKYSTHEAALLVAYSFARGLHQQYQRRANWLVNNKVKPIQADWVKKGLIRTELVTPWEKKLSERLAAGVADDPSGGAPLAEPAEFPFSPSLPDITRKDSSRVFRLGDFMALLVKDTVPVSQRVGFGPLPFPLTYPYAMVLFDPRAKAPLCFVTLEKGLAAHPFLGMFRQNGEHSNLGPAPELLSEPKFVERALSLLCLEFSIQSAPQEVGR